MAGQKMQGCASGSALMEQTWTPACGSCSNSNQQTRSDLLNQTNQVGANVNGFGFQGPVAELYLTLLDTGDNLVVS